MSKKDKWLDNDGVDAQVASLLAERNTFKEKVAALVVERTRLRVKVGKLTAERDRYREALEKMARDGCGETRITPAGDGVGYIHKRCRDLWPDGQDRWCWSCQADFALQPESEEPDEHD